MNRYGGLLKYDFDQNFADFNINTVARTPKVIRKRHILGSWTTR